MNRSSVPQFRVGVPAAVVGQLRGKHVLFYLSERVGPPSAKIVKIGEMVEFSLDTKDSIIAAARRMLRFARI